MKVTTRIVEDIEDLFTQFQLDIDPSHVKWPRCIAYENPAGDDVRAIYEVYVNNELRFFGFAGWDTSLVIDDELAWMKQWARTDDVTLLKAKDTEILFKLKGPFRYPVYQAVATICRRHSVIIQKITRNMLHAKAAKNGFLLQVA